MDRYAYQRRAVGRVMDRFARGATSVLLVSPPGSGKTVMGIDVDGRCGARSLWVAPTREIVLQTAGRLRTRFGRVGVILSGHATDPGARVQIASIQTLLRREPVQGIGTLILDECHHDVADAWGTVVSRHRQANQGIRCLGLTATPDRADGRPQSELFGELVLAATYSELIACGTLLPCRLVQPEYDLGSHLAADPVDAWAEHSEGSSAIVYAPRVSIAVSHAQRFESYGIRAAVVHEQMTRAKRDRAIELFRREIVRVLVNVAVLTEGLHIEAARTVILARSYQHRTPYLQATGRALAGPKRWADAILIDLVGSSIRHGSPTMDREYTLGERPEHVEAEERDSGKREEFSQEVRPTPLRMVQRGALPQGSSPQPVALVLAGARRQGASAPRASAATSTAYDVTEGYLP